MWYTTGNTHLIMLPFTVIGNSHLSPIASIGLFLKLKLRGRVPLAPHRSISYIFGGTPLKICYYKSSCFIGRSLVPAFRPSVLSIV